MKQRKKERRKVGTRRKQDEMERDRQTKKEGKWRKTRTDTVGEKKKGREIEHDWRRQ